MILLDGMNAKLALLTAAHALRPDIAEQTIGEQAKVMRSRRRNDDARTLAAEAGPLKRDGVFPRRQLSMHRSAGPGACLERSCRTLEFQQDIWQCNISLVTDVSNQHSKPQSRE